MKSIRLPISPISANEAWSYNKRGFRYKTKEYTLYQKQVLSYLEAVPADIPDGLLFFKANFGVSRKDLDNCEKPFIDTLEKAYDFNDSKIDEIHVKKHRVPKDCEYIEFALYPLEDSLPLDFENDDRCTYKLLKGIIND